MTCTNQHLWFQNTPHNLQNFVHSIGASLCYMQQHCNPNASDVNSFSTHSNHPKGRTQSRVEGHCEGKYDDVSLNQRLSFDRDRIQGFIWEHIRGHIRIANVGRVNDERARDLPHDIILLNPVTTCHFQPFQVMSLRHRSRCSLFREW